MPVLYVLLKSLGEKVTTLLDRQTYCFAPETLVSTNSGPVRIETIECGDHVAAYDFESGQINYYEVIDTHRNEYHGAWVEIKLESGEAIGVTANHPFWVVAGEDLESRPIPVHDDSELVEHSPHMSGRWVFSHHLRIGDVLAKLDGGQVAIDWIDVRLEESRTVCNLTVDNSHNFFVSSAFVLAHNADIKWCTEYANFLGHAVKPAALLRKVEALDLPESLIHAHHIVMNKGLGALGKVYTRRSQRLLEKYNIETLKSSASLKRAQATGDFDNMCYALNKVDGIHSTEYARYISESLAKVEANALKNGDDAGQAIRNQLGKWKTQFERGNAFWHKPFKL